MSAIAALGGGRVGLAAKQATSTIPIVFVGGDDPINLGLVASLNRPGGNVTGVVLLTADILGKRMEMLGEVIPMGGRIGVLVNPTSSFQKTALAEVERAARLIDRQIIISDASTERELETAFVSLVEHQANAVFISPDPFFSDKCLR